MHTTPTSRATLADLQPHDSEEHGGRHEYSCCPDDEQPVVRDALPVPAVSNGEGTLSVAMGQRSSGTGGSTHRCSCEWPASTLRAASSVESSRRSTCRKAGGTGSLLPRPAPPPPHRRTHELALLCDDGVEAAEHGREVCYVCLVAEQGEGRRGWTTARR